MQPEHVALVQTIVLIVQTVVLGITGYFVWRYTDATKVYTKETAELRKETVRQTRVSLRPVVLPIIGPDDFRMSNYGVGCAVNVRIAPVRTDRQGLPDLDLGEIESRFEHIDYLPANNEKKVNVTHFADGQQLRETIFDKWFYPQRRGPETTLEITFQDIEGQRYRIRATIEAGVPTSAEHRKVVIGPIEPL